MAAKYTVTDVAERRRFSAQGREITYVDIAITTAKGATGSIRIPRAEYDAKAVKEALDKLAAELDMPFGLA